MTMAPEVLNNLSYDSACDVWSVGCMIFEMLEGRAPFKPANGGGIEELKRVINRRNLVFENPAVSTEAKDLIDKMLQINPKDRITWPFIFHHEWFTECVTKGEEHLRKISQDYKGYVLYEEKHFDPAFAKLFGFALRDFVNYYINTYFKSIKHAYESLL